MGPVDCPLKVCDLPLAIAHGRKQRADIGIVFEGILDSPHNVGSGVDNLPGGILLGSNHPGTIGHPPMGQGGAILHDQHSLSRDQLRVVDENGGGGVHHQGPRIDSVYTEAYLFDVLGIRGHDLVDDDHICHQEVGLAGVVGVFMAGAMRVHQGDLQVRPVKRGVVVATVPDDDLGFLFCLF